ncbi:MAG: DUF1846 domain-containing protein [candidate division WOR-3 bacterium]|nr:MAG: DUF1846 domain-containing protein [candidate division WOR-3 bacterium]
MNQGFDNQKYVREQSDAILNRVNQFNNRLYLEFGGKLIFDYHASRVLPGFHPNVKMQLLQQLKDKMDILLCIYAGDIERKKVRADFGITYDVDTLRLIDDLKDWGLSVKGVVITRFDNQPTATIFKNKLERSGIKVFTHMYTKGYPTDVDTVVSDEGYGANEFIETDKSLVVVAGPGPGSGKLATCLSQLYHDYRRGMKSGYAKFETFPIWNIPLKHPVNVAYEAATADIGDFNVIDPFHLEAYGKTSINYNRDVEVFPVLQRILMKIMGTALYKSPTDMGVNRAGFCIIDDEAVQEAAKQELIRRYFRYRCEYVMGFVDRETVQKVELLMEDMNIKPEDRSVVEPSRRAAVEAREKGKGNEGIFCGAAIQLHDGTIITGKNSVHMHAASSMVLNAVKKLADIPDKIHLLSPMVIESITSLDKYFLESKKTVSLDLEETLIALSISATTNPTAQLALERLRDLEGCEVHITYIPTTGDEKGLRKLGVNLTSDPNFSSSSLFTG